MRRADFQTVGPFGDITIAEDIDWGERARAKGLTFCYVEDMVVAHPPRHSLRELCAKWHRHLIHSINRERTKPHWKMRWIIWAMAVLVSPFLDVFRIVTSNRISGARTRLKAAGILAATRCYRAWVMLSLLIVERAISWNPSPKDKL
jgi:GT2 family glycosyltransferase